MERLIQQIIEIDRLLNKDRDESERTVKVALLREMIYRRVRGYNPISRAGIMPVEVSPVIKNRAENGIVD
jgi:hypothetical protein